MNAEQPDPVPLYYTFGNHMHWVDMEWLWGYEVLSGSVRDMLEYCRIGDVRGNINFDGAGYERLCTEAPETFRQLAAAVASGTVEIVGASYGQPYGLFHGGESNVRQRVWGVRTVQRLFGLRPRTFWEEEFDFFPQLPQMLTQTGYTHASLFFQWTWHTPSLPEEQIPAVRWRGIDGSTLLTATKNSHCVHQWPEDLRVILSEPELVDNGGALVQWLELMPSPDWMCRSELMLPLLRDLRDNPQFDLRACTLREYLDTVAERAPDRSYGLGDVYHGMSLGKNGDLFRRLSREAESTVLSAESAATVASMFGRPYPHWDAYPTWELDEAWRELLLAQHHDNDECEGLCGFVGRRSYERACATAATVRDRSVSLLARRAGMEGSVDDHVFFWNPLSWERESVVEIDGTYHQTPAIPASGYALIERSELKAAPAPRIEQDTNEIWLIGRFNFIAVCRRTGTLRLGRDPGESETAKPGGYFKLEQGDERQIPEAVEACTDNGWPAVCVHYAWPDGSLDCTVTLQPGTAGSELVSIRMSSTKLPKIEPKYAGALMLSVPVGGEVLHDHPYAISSITPTGEHVKKYPTGDWMTSPQEYEVVANPVTALSFYDVSLSEESEDSGRRLQLIHDGSQAGFLTEQELRIVLSMNDPWDESYFVRTLDAHFFLRMHGPEGFASLRQAADALLRPLDALTVRDLLPPETGSSFVPPFQDRPFAIPRKYSLCSVTPDSVCITSVQRESGWVDLFSDYAGTGVSMPMVLRLVEYDGRQGEVQVRIAGSVRSAVRTNLLGEREADRSQPSVTRLSDESLLGLHMEPHEIVTLYIDLEEAEPVPRNLDEHRDRWAHAHRVPAGDADGGREGGRA